MTTGGSHYVYALYQEDGTPFYIGISYVDRVTDHVRFARNSMPGDRYDHIRAMQRRGAHAETENCTRD